VILLPIWDRRGVVGVLQRAEQAEVTYPEQGETRSERLPIGYHHDRRELGLGQGDRAWERACDAIRRWEAHRSSGFVITPAGVAIEAGATVVASRPVGPIILAIPCRIIYRTDEPNEFGFAYGTLPGHPERGEEAFHVRRGPDGSVTAQIVAFSRPDDLLTRIAAPVARRIQAVATSRYLAGIERYVRAGAEYWTGPGSLA
jgi:uncharacterized protein (UPF0548 family)